MAIKITEVELNPPGSDFGNEWVELFSNSTIDLSDFYLENNDGEKYNLSSTFKSYIVIRFEKQWLDNTDEKVYLKKGNKIVFETPFIEDISNDKKTWNLCNDWVFSQSSKEKPNPCLENKPNLPNDISPIKTHNKRKDDVIFLGDSIKKSTNLQDIIITKHEKIRINIVISFTILLLIIVFLLSFNKL